MTGAAMDRAFMEMQRDIFDVCERRACPDDSRALSNSPAAYVAPELRV